MKVKIIIITLSLFLLANNVLFAYSYLFDVSNTAQRVSVCKDDKESCCYEDEDGSKSCCKKDNCCTTIPNPLHFSISIIIGEGFKQHTSLAVETTLNNVNFSNLSSSTLSDGFLNTLYKPPAT